jgi:hypothetical protein
MGWDKGVVSGVGGGEGGRQVHATERNVLNVLPSAAAPPRGRGG